MVGSRMSARRWMGGYGIGDGPLRHRLYFASQAILVLIGFILLLLGPERVTTLANLLPAVGASLVATGLAGAVLFLRVWMDQEQSERLRDLHEFGIRRVFSVRSVRIGSEYEKRLGRASEQIDIMGFGLKALREDHGHNFRKWAERASVRILLLDPEFPSVDQPIADLRDSEENHADGDIRKDVRQFLEHCGGLMEDRNVRFEIRLYRCLPSINLFRIDDEIFWGPYLIADVSRNMPTFLMERRGRLAEKLVNHFETIWKSDRFSRPASSQMKPAVKGVKL